MAMSPAAASTETAALPPPAQSPTGERVLTALALAAACAFAGVLGVRTLTTPDLGYHLAYGDWLLDRGQLVDGGRFLHPDAIPANPRFDLSPGAWIDETGTYRFPNANWLSQAVMALVHRAAGLEGLSVLLAGLVVGILALAVATMRRLGLGRLWTAAGLILIAMVAYERFLLRPELFGYLLLMVQLLLLARGGIGRATAAILVVLQAVLVNLHSYFLLGLGLTGAVLAEEALRWLLSRRGGDSADQRRAAAARVRRLGLVLAGQVGVCFLNPWGWRLVALPIQTLVFMRKHGIAGGDYDATGHPWSVIGEFFRPFAPGVFEQSKASYAYLVLLVVAGLGLAASAWRRRWAHALVIAVMAAASLAMRRNIAPGALIITPLALSACRAVLAGLGRGADRQVRWPWRAGVAAVLAAAGALGAVSVVSQRFYRNERRAVRFGLGVARTVVPVGAAEWINAHKPAGRLWTDYNSSSNVMYFTRPRRAVPVLTNTWAYPPDVMERVLDYSRGRRPFGSAEKVGDYRIVVLRMDRTSIPLGRRLAEDPSWALVHLGALHAVFLRSDGPNAELARRGRLAPETLDVDAYVRRLRGLDPVGSYSTYLGAFTLAHLGWSTPAIEVIDDVVRRYPDDPYLHRVWNMRGTCLTDRANARIRAGLGGVLDDLQKARDCFLRAMKLRPDYAPARENLRRVERQIARERRLGRLGDAR